METIVAMETSANMETVQAQPGQPPRNGQDLLRMVKNDPAQLDKIISCLHNALKLGTAPPESQPTVCRL